MPWDWMIEGSTFHCFRAPTSRQLEQRLHEPCERRQISSSLPDAPNPFHDAELMEATKPINEILDRVSHNNRDHRRKL